MRTDLTVRTSTGKDCDLAVFAPAGTTWAAVRGLVHAAAAGADPRWCGAHALRAGMVVGRAPLVTGAVLTAGRSADRPTSTMRLDVVGGRDCGASAALGATPVTIGRDPCCDLVLTDPRVSRRHMRVDLTASGPLAVDLDSTAGSYDSGTPVTTARFAHDTVLRIGASFVAVTGVPGRTPRPAPVPVPEPPGPPVGPPRLPLLASLLPALLGAGLALLTGSWEFLAFAALTPAAALAGAVGERRHSRRQHRAALARYHVDRAASDCARSIALRAEAVHRRREYPHPGAALGDRRALRDGADPGLLRVRIGLGALPSCLQPASQVVDVPVTIDLAAGPVAIAGPRDATRAVARSLLVQLALATSPHDVAFAIGDRAGWQWARWLPHATTTGARHVIAVHAMGTNAPPTDDATTAIVLVDEVADTPPGCATRVVVDDESGAMVRVHGPDGRTCTALADRIDSEHAELVARALAGTIRAAPQRGAIPAECRLVDLIGDEPVRARWARSTGSAGTTLGVSASGPVTVDLDRDGPHVLVAGSTGAGKSELLQCLVAGLAMRHPPSEMSFLLVDYKGGAAFGACARLPHTVGLVTDLDEHLTRRVLAALDSEINRRERLFATVGAGDLGAYRAADGAPPIARLVLVVDEFATLADELGSFVPSLVAIARRGRSLGLHLVLATQRPSGAVSPEIRANTALRICLRVTSAAESVDVVETAAAADIAQNTPGRAILRAGADNRTFQIARVGAASADDRAGPVTVVPLEAWRTLPAPPRPAGGTDLDRFVAQARAANEGMPLPHRPWLAPLPRVLPLAEVDTADLVAVGRVDLPAEQRQPPLTIDLDAGAALLITGRSRSGRTTALHTIAHAAATHRRPDELHVYGIDATGGGLAHLRALPHVGTLATAGEGFHVVARLVERLLAGPAHRALLLVDGWDELLCAADDHDGGRTTENLMSLLRSASQRGLTVAVTGGRATLAPRLSTLATARYVLALNDAAEYAAAGVPPRSVPTTPPPPGRGLRLGDWAAVQFAAAGRSDTVTGGPAREAIRIRPLPRSIPLGRVTPGNGTVLGAYGDDCDVATVDLIASDARMLVAGPPRSGRTTVLRTILRQHEGCAVIAPPRSPLSAAAAHAGALVVHRADELPRAGLLLVDDLEQIAESALGDAIAEWAGGGTLPRAVVAAGRADALALGYRGVIAQLRTACCGILLRPCAADAALLGVAVPTSRMPLPPGRGVLVPDPRWNLGGDPVPIQVATP